MEKILYPEAKKIVLSNDGDVRVGRYTIGSWDKDYVSGTSHFRPSPNEGKVYYTASLNNDSYVQSDYKNDLRDEIADACKDGVTGEYIE